jgi:hypothetical protein
LLNLSELAKERRDALRLASEGKNASMSESNRRIIMMLTPEEKKGVKSGLDAILEKNNIDAIPDLIEQKKKTIKVLDLEALTAKRANRYIEEKAELEGRVLMNHRKYYNTMVSKFQNEGINKNDTRSYDFMKKHINNYFIVKTIELKKERLMVEFQYF